MGYNTEHLNKLIRERMKYCCLYDSQMMQITKWAPIVSGKTDFGVYNGAGTIHVSHFATWDGSDWQTFMMQTLDIPVYCYAGMSLILNHAIFDDTPNLIRDYYTERGHRGDTFLQ